MRQRAEADPPPEARGARGGHRLLLPLALASELSAAAETGYPEEVCGLLLGKREESLSEVIAVHRAANLNRERARDRYELDPLDLLAAERGARARGLEIVGVWHSHPEHPAVPSVTDLAAAWPGWSYVIVSVAAEGAGELRSWRLLAGRFVEEVVDDRDESLSFRPK